MGTHALKSRAPQQVVIAGRFSTAADGTANPNPTTGQGWSVAKSAEGTYLITLSDSYVGVDAVVVCPVTSTGAWTGAYSTHSFGSGTYTVTIKTFTAGAAADVDSGAIHFVLYLNQTGARSAP